MEKRYFKYEHELVLESGEVLPRVEICYHISREYGALGQEGEPCGGNAPSGCKQVVWITHALTANSNPCEWWDTIVGEGKFLDPRKYTIICANILGSCYGSTSPLSANPQTGKPYMLGFPKTTVRDIVLCHELLRKELGIEKIDLLVGGSVGGFQALEWSIMNAPVIKNLVLLACGARVTPWLSAFNESMRMALYTDPSFEQQPYERILSTCSYSKTQSSSAVNLQQERWCFTTTGGAKGLATARSIALISYRSYAGYNSTQYEQDVDTLWSSRAASYQQYQGKKLTDRFNAYSYLSMVNITDSHNIGRGRGGVEKALALVTANTICIGINSDNLFPCNEQKLLAEHIPNALYREITSMFGHDGFLLEWQQITPILKDILTQDNY